MALSKACCIGMCDCLCGERAPRPSCCVFAVLPPLAVLPRFSLFCAVHARQQAPAIWPPVPLPYRGWCKVGGLWPDGAAEQQLCRNSVHHSDVHVFCCSLEDMALALRYPWDMGDSAAAAQKALVYGYTAAIHTVLHTLPPKPMGSTMPTTMQVVQAQSPSCMVAELRHQNMQPCSSLGFFA